MKPRYESDSDNDAPEAVSHFQSKKAMREQAVALQQFQNEEKKKKRAKNRERDRKLKQQAATKKGKQAAFEDSGEEDSGEASSEDDGDAAIMARMRKAMQEAEGESDEDWDIGMDAGDGESNGMDEDESDDDDEEFHGFDAPKRKNANHLPDHIFTAAFASQSSSAPSEKKSRAKLHKEKQKEKKRARAKPKDIIVGSRIVRSSADNGTPSGTSTMRPSRKIRKFLDRTLALKSGGDARQRGWERRPASVGSLRTGGPAARFVRT